MAIRTMVDLVRAHGTEHALASALSPERSGGVGEALKRQGRLIAHLVAIIEKKHVIRRGHVVSLLYAAEGVKEPGAEHEKLEP